MTHDNSVARETDISLSHFVLPVNCHGGAITKATVNHPVRCSFTECILYASTSVVEIAIAAPPSFSKRGGKSTREENIISCNLYALSVNLSQADQTPRLQIFFPMGHVSRTIFAALGALVFSVYIVYVSYVHLYTSPHWGVRQVCAVPPASLSLST
jgi:hypothetical protein